MNWTDVRDEILGLVFQRTEIQVSKLSLDESSRRTNHPWVLVEDPDGNVLVGSDHK